MTDFELDVRPLLRQGGDPFSAIMEAVSQLEQGQRLKLYASFKPEPLFAVMARQGFGNTASPLENGDWMVLFTPTPEQHADLVPSHADLPDTWPDPAYYLDCTELDPQQFKDRILVRLDTMDEGEVMFALLLGEPLPLFAELKARGHAWVGDVDETGAIYRLMIRAGHRS